MAVKNLGKRREKEGITGNAAWSVQFQIYYLFLICGKRNDDDDGDDDGNDKEQKINPTDQTTDFNLWLNSIFRVFRSS